MRWMYVFKAVGDTLNTNNGLFKIIPGSHNMSDDQLTRARRKDIAVKPNEVLITDGMLIIDWPTAGGGFALLKMIEVQNY